MEVLIYVILFIMGAFIGSFASLAVYRIPIKEDILIKHSYCPNCNEKLTLKDLIPIFSYIFLRGKCSHCGQKIRLRYLILEVVSGLLFLLFFLSFNVDFYKINLNEILLISFIAVFFITLILIAGIDKERKRIEKSIIFLDILLVILYILFIFWLKVEVWYSLIILLVEIIFYLGNKYFIKDDKKRNIIYFIILILLSRIFANSYIVLFATILTVITSFIHKKLAKTEVPVAFYYVVYFISIFIGSNFIV